MKWRCVNNITGYCSGEPKWAKRPKKLGEGEFLASGSCELDPKTCGKFQALSQQLGRMRLPKSQYKVVKGGRHIRRRDD